ncbi:MAG TPA: hypothetical protein PK364_01805 [Synergistaceae bacterium]|nr:hypothetical protein [Synergistaceae bacterium]HPJ26318.1 hypothetical protein [Synergistaceae bacterium]HPQ37298.1 hypothetical protein [Synergistaceae bacterium]
MNDKTSLLLLLRMGGIFFILAGLGLEVWGMWHHLGTFRWLGPLLALSGVCDLFLASYLKRKS